MVRPSPMQYSQTCLPVPLHCEHRASSSSSPTAVAPTAASPSPSPCPCPSPRASSTYGSPRRVSTIRCTRGRVLGSASGRENGVQPEGLASSESLGVARHVRRSRIGFLPCVLMMGMACFFAVTGAATAAAARAGVVGRRPSIRDKNRLSTIFSAPFPAGT